MMVASEAEEAWWPPTFSPSSLSRRWLALWTVQVASQSTFRSSSARISRRSDPLLIRASLWLHPPYNTTGPAASQLAGSFPHAILSPADGEPAAWRAKIARNRERRAYG